MKMSVENDYSFPVGVGSGHVQSKDLALGWYNLTYFGDSWQLTDEKKPILCQLKGCVDFGTLTALMGPSGSGKTTLLNCINGDKWSGLSNKSRIYVSKFEKIRSCYIVQKAKEQLMMDLTVKEAVLYSSWIKNRNVKINHEKNIHSILSDFMLNDCANNLLKNCSGSEQKLVSIAIELTELNKPNLFCFDEPTSGLDSTVAEQAKIISHFKLLKNFFTFFRLWCV